MIVDAVTVLVGCGSWLIMANKKFRMPTFLVVVVDFITNIYIVERSSTKYVMGNISEV